MLTCNPAGLFCRAPIHEGANGAAGNKPLKDAIGAIEHPPSHLGAQPASNCLGVRRPW